MLDYSGLLAVAAVVREGSFEKAAKALHLTPSAVSQRVKLLEQKIGAVLIVRGQPCVATEQGELLCRHVEQVRMLEDGLSERLPTILAAATDLSRLTIPVAINADSLATWFVEAAALFAERADYLLNIFIDDQEHTTEWLLKGKVVGTVTANGSPIQGCKCIPLGAMRYHATASPAFMEKHFPKGVTAAGLSNAPAFTFDRKDRLQEQWIRLVAGEVLSFPTHWLPSTQGFVEGSIAGMGWGMSPSQLVNPHLDSGSLVELIPGKVIDVPLYWQIRGITIKQLAELTDSIVTTARRALVKASVGLS